MDPSWLESSSSGSSLSSRFPTVVRLARTVRRHVLLRRRILAALCLGLATWCALQVLRPPEPRQVQTLVAARDLPAGTTLAAADLRMTAWAPDAVPDGHLSRAEGEVLAAPVRRGEPITDARVLGKGLTLASPETVALAVRIADAPSVDLVDVGDAVDVIAVPAVGAESSGSEGRRAQVLVSGARVLALPRTDAVAANGLDEARVVVLEVSRAATVEISQAAAWDWLSLALTQ